MSDRKSARELHAEHEDHRNEAATLVRALARHEEALRRRTVDRLVGVLVQPPEPQHFQPHVRVSPRRVMDVPDLPGGPSSDWDGCVS